MRIAILANTKSPNPGNWALIQGTKNLLEMKFGSDIEYVEISWDDITFSDSNFGIDFFNTVNSCDLLWIVGAVMFNGRPDHIKGGSRFNLDISEIEKISVPIVFGGVSYRSWNNKYPNLKALNTVLEYLESRANCLFAVRNDGTKDWLEKKLTKRFDFLEFPDPGLFSLEKFSNNNKKSGMIISVNNEDSDFRYNNTQIKNQLILSLKNACMSFWGSHDEAIGLAPHSFEDYQMLLELIGTFPKQMLHQKTYVLPLLLGKKSEDFYKFYTSPRLVIASRVHSMSPSLGFGNVTLVVNTQDRIARYLQDIDFADIGVSLHEIEQDSLVVSKKCSYLYSNLDLWQLRVKSLRENQQNLAIKFMNLVSELL